VYDRCKRPKPIYNNKYNPYALILSDIDKTYSPYVYGEPLYNDRAIIVANLPWQHTLAGAAKRQRTSWVWNLGYALIDNSKLKKPLMWAYKLCMYKSRWLYLVLLAILGHYDPIFAARKTIVFAGNTLSNVEKHLQEQHKLDEGEDI
jgi:hypothetical protein